MSHLQAVSHASDVVVPSTLLAVLNDIILIGRCGILNLITNAAVGKARDSEHAGFSQVNELAPPHEVTLISRVVARIIAVVAILSIVHNTPNVHTKSNVLGIIEIRKAKCVAEFVNENANTIRLTNNDVILLAGRTHFASDSIGGKNASVDGFTFRHLFRPDVIAIGA